MSVVSNLRPDFTARSYGGDLVPETDIKENGKQMVLTVTMPKKADAKKAEKRIKIG